MEEKNTTYYSNHETTVKYQKLKCSANVHNVAELLRNQ
jgi:hypothetical protein